jgi:hypothetical protein
MKVSELRLGNYIYHNGEVVPVVQIERRYKTMYRLNDLDVDERIIEDHFQPIPLTPEWLERCGWQLVDQGRGPYYWLEKQCWFHIHLPEDGTLYANFNNNAVHIKYLHQLQNLYFALTGEELTINNVNLQSTS